MNEQEMLSEIRDGLAPELAGLDPKGECPKEALEYARELLLRWYLKVLYMKAGRPNVRNPMHNCKGVP